MRCFSRGELLQKNYIPVADSSEDANLADCEGRDGDWDGGVVLELRLVRRGQSWAGVADFLLGRPRIR